MDTLRVGDFLKEENGEKYRSKWTGRVERMGNVTLSKKSDAKM